MWLIILGIKSPLWKSPWFKSSRFESPGWNLEVNFNLRVVDYSGDQKSIVEESMV